MKLRLARFAAGIERGVDRFRKTKLATAIETYTGYATQEDLVVRGRVLSDVRTSDVRVNQSKLTNLSQMVRLFMTNEVAGVPVSAQGYETVSDEEGYFTLLIPRSGQTGRVEIEVRAGQVTAICPVLVPSPDATLGVISDIDDTMMETGAYSLWRNVWTSMTGNALTRTVFPDAVKLIEILQAGVPNPAYFVSSSPWNLHGFLNQVFAQNGLPEAPKFLRDYGISEIQFITGTHGDHKGSAIDRILKAHPSLSFVLIGDTGQHDAQVYHDAIERHPNRFTHVVLREPGAGADTQDMAYVRAIQRAGVPVIVGSDYRQAIATLRPDR